MSENLSAKKIKAIASRILSIAKQHGGEVTPEQIVKDAKDPKSPYHDCFEWDDRKAAAEQRLETARGLIRRVKVEIEFEEKLYRVPALIRNPEKDSSEQGYLTLERVRSRKDIARAALTQELSRAIAALQRACDLADVLGISKEASSILKRVQVLREKMAA